MSSSSTSEYDLSFSADDSSWDSDWSDDSSSWTSTTTSVDYYSSDTESEDDSSCGSDLEDELTFESEDQVPEHLEPLYEGAPLTVLDSYLLIFEYSLRNSLTKKAFEELLKLVAVHLPDGAKISPSVYRLKQFFLNIFPDVTAGSYKYCGICHQLLHDQTCSNTTCAGGATREFLYVPVAPQLKQKLQDPRVWDALQKRFSLPTRVGDSVITDIYDGTEYKKHHTILSHPGNVSFILNTDGVALFKSSKKGIWPIWLAINELPSNRRFSRRNMILAGLWFSEEKPTMTSFLRPLMLEMNDLMNKGVEVTTPSGPLIARAILLLSSVDLPARALVTNMKQYNGKHACCYCESEGQPRRSSHLHRNWPHEDVRLARSNDSIKRDARAAIQHHKSVKGVKGASALFLHPPFNVAKGVVIDALHCIFLGVILNMVTYWFHASHKGKDYNIRFKVHLCDKRLMNIKVPDTITRPPRSLTDAKHWKGSELRAWVLLYSVPVLHGLLPLPYFTHYCYLVSALHILLSDSISTSDLRCAATFLDTFYSRCEDLYGCNFATMNVHMLSHLVECVYNWGPLWAYSCFGFEGVNGHLKGFFHGSREMNKQLAFSYTMAQMLPVLHDVRRASTKVQALLDTFLEKRRYKKNNPLKEHPTSWIVGRVCKTVVPNELLPSLNSFLVQHYKPEVQSGHSVLKFYRVLAQTNLLYSKEYTRVKSRNSYTICYISSHTGQLQFRQIQYFVGVEGYAFAVLSNFHVNESSPLHCALGEKCRIIPVVAPGTLSLLSINFIVRKCVFVNYSAQMFICVPPNDLTQD